MIRLLIILMTLINYCYMQAISDYSYHTAESSSLAGGIVSTKGGDWSLFNNPATLVDLDENSVTVGYSNLYNQEYLPMTSLGLIISKFKLNFGLKYNSFKVDYRNTELLNEQEIGFLTAFNLLKDRNSSLSVGATVNYYLTSFGPSAGITGDGSDGINSGDISTVGVDLGLIASLREKNRFGIFIKNINSQSIGRGISNQDLPKKIDMGISFIPNNMITISFSLEQLLGYPSPQFRTSFKYKLSKLLCLNAGVQMNPNRVGVGFVIKSKLVSISYGYLTHHILPATHHSNIGIRF